jgi:hypothetical protein
MGSKDIYPISLVQGIWGDGQCASSEDNDAMLRSFLPDDLDFVLEDTKADTALGPVVLFKYFWRTALFPAPKLPSLKGGIFTMGLSLFMRLFTSCLLRKPAVILKLDFEKAYGKVSWAFPAGCPGA